MYGIFTYIYHRINHSMFPNIPWESYWIPWVMSSFQGFELCLRESRRKNGSRSTLINVGIHAAKNKHPMAPSLYTLKTWQGKNTRFLEPLLKAEEQWNDITSGPVKTPVTVGKMIWEVKGPLLTFTIRILSDCCSVWPGPNVYNIYIEYGPATVTVQ